VSGTERDALDRRPDPDELLARYRDDAGTTRSGATGAGTGHGSSGATGAIGRGRLRLYVGMAPGVGKTYRMLEEGHRRSGRGTDVVVGYVEDHGRPLTAALVEGLEVVPRRRIEHRGIVVEELDPEAVVRRHPTVALVDELAHTNAPGSPREKRWQDVEALRDAGIHVISTMNVQHLDSLADAVATITGAPVNERLPDEVLLSADEIELVDMSPHALRQRMRHGNVYPETRARVALDRFFTEANLTALRELSLRVVADRVEGQLEAVSHGSMPLVSDRVAVYVDGSRASGLAVRRAAGLAGRIHAGLVAFVPPSTVTDALSFDARRDLREALDVARDLSADVVELGDGEVDEALGIAAKAACATHLFVPQAQAGMLARITRASLPERLARRLPDVDLHLVGGRD
jgi:two-component system, OmpR family, sensor histidine kinase KdpD